MIWAYLGLGVGLVGFIALVGFLIAAKRADERDEALIIRLRGNKNVPAAWPLADHAPGAAQLRTHRPRAD